MGWRGNGIAETTPGCEQGGHTPKRLYRHKLHCPTKQLLLPMGGKVRPSYLLTTQTESSSFPNVCEANNRTPEYSKQMLMDSKGEIANPW